MNLFEPDPDLVDLVDSFFSARVDHDLVLTAERDGETDSLWGDVAALELPWIGVDEDRGGSGGTFADQVVVQLAAGRHSVPLPIAETYVVAHTLASHNIPLADRGAATIVDRGCEQLILHEDSVSGSLDSVVWVGTATSALVVVGHTTRPAFVVLDLVDHKVPAGRDLAGQPLAALTFDHTPARIVPTDHSTVAQLRARLALIRAAQMAGAMRGVLDLTTEYVTTRSQFGKPLAAFQAVQRLAVEVAEWELLTRIAVETAALSDVHDPVAALSVKYLANAGAQAVVASSHQAHGAMGMTQEYSLQDLSRRLNLWRGEHGAEREVSNELGLAAVSRRSVYSTVVEAGGPTV